MKFVTNLSLGILGQPDDFDFWFTILSNRQMRRACKKAKKILVVAGGHGSEVDVLVKLHGPEIVKKIWFNDLLVCYTNEIKARYPHINILKGDFLKLECDMKFGVVVGNPPYQDPTNDKRMIWNQILDKSVEMCEPDGHLAMVTPTTWLTAKTNIHNSYKLFEELQVTRAVIFDKNDKPFDEGTTVSYTITKNKQRTKTTPLYYSKYSKKQETFIADVDIPKEKIWPGQLEPMDLSIHEKLKAHEKIVFLKSCEFHNQKLKKKKIVSDTQSASFPYTHHVSAAITRYTSEKFSDHDKWKVMVPLTSTIDKVVIDKDCGHGEDMLSIYVDDGSIAKNIQKIFSTKLYRFIGKMYKNGRNQPLQNIFPKIDFSKTWKDEELYKHFGLTEEEIKYIESNYK